MFRGDRGIQVGEALIDLSLEACKCLGRALKRRAETEQATGGLELIDHAAQRRPLAISNHCLDAGLHQGLELRASHSQRRMFWIELTEFERELHQGRRVVEPLHGRHERVELLLEAGNFLLGGLCFLTRGKIALQGGKLSIAGQQGQAGTQDRRRSWQIRLAKKAAHLIRITDGNGSFAEQAVLRIQPTQFPQQPRETLLAHSGGEAARIERAFIEQAAEDEHALRPLLL